MPTKDQVIDLHRKHPDWTSKQVAIAIIGANVSFEQLERTSGWVRATASRNGIQFCRTVRPPKEPKPHFDSIWALGRAARAAGLTVADIIDIGESLAEI